jgi:hypothetical protein
MEEAVGALDILHGVQVCYATWARMGFHLRRDCHTDGSIIRPILSFGSFAMVNCTSLAPSGSWLKLVAEEETDLTISNLHHGSSDHGGQPGKFAKFSSNVAVRRNAASLCHTLDICNNIQLRLRRSGRLSLEYQRPLAEREAVSAVWAPI